MPDPAGIQLRSNKQPNIYLNLDVVGTLLLGALRCEWHFGMRGVLSRGGTLEWDSHFGMGIPFWEGIVT